jgi:SAM-dependent methyltransferase
MHHSYLDFLVCPVGGEPLRLGGGAEYDGDFIRRGTLASPSGRTYPIVDFVPRFTGEGYAASFSLEWQRHPDILRETKSNYQLYRTRFSAETKWEEDLTGQFVLEAACGPGALTPYPLERGATVVSFDLSNSVDQTRASIGANPRSLIVQASMFSLPFRPGSFDKCFCFGVIQSTPDPRGGFAALVKMLKPGGQIAADCYVVPDPKEGGGHRIIRAKYRFRRLGLHKLPPKMAHFIIRQYVNAMWPLYQAWKTDPKRAEWLRSMLLDDYNYRLPGMHESRHKEFAVLDIFDFLASAYDLPETVDSFRSFFEEAGLVNIDVHPGYNGIEGRGIKSFTAGSN